MWDSSQLSNLIEPIDTKDFVGVNKLRVAMYTFLMQSKKSPRSQRMSLKPNGDRADGPALAQDANGTCRRQQQKQQQTFIPYKLFRKPDDVECAQFPTYASVFGEPRFMNPFADEDAQVHRQTGIQSTYDGIFTEIPRTLLNDRFGMIGLLSIMRTAKSLPEMTMLSLGEDLTKYGFDMNCEHLLYCNFNGPYTNEPAPHSDESDSTDDEVLKELRRISSLFKPRQTKQELQNQQQQQQEQEQQNQQKQQKQPN